VGHVAVGGEMRNAYKLSVDKPEEKIPFRRPSCRWKDYIKIRFK